MRGTIISLSDQYGFILCSDKVSYYFNPKHMQASHRYSALKINDTVEFEPHPGRKGMMALAVRPASGYDTLAIGNLFMFARVGRNPFRDNEWVARDQSVNIQSEWFHNPQSGKEHLLNTAKAAGANCLFDVDMQSRKHHDETGYRTVFAWTGSAGVYGSRIKVETPEEAETRRQQALRVREEVRARLLGEELQEAPVAMPPAKAYPFHSLITGSLLGGMLFCAGLLLYVAR
ncbi:cold-shock protein [Geopseudomonas aromaticivorans]